MEIKELSLKHEKMKSAIRAHLESFKGKTDEEKYKEFIFCILTPQSNARKCWEAVEIIFDKNPLTEDEVAGILRGRSRFHNTKARRVLAAKETWKAVNPLLGKASDRQELRNAISSMVNGYGLKEASHFLRNVGLSDSKIAILDRHIIRNLVLLGAIKESSKIDKKSYLAMESQALQFAAKSRIPMDELDVLFWHNEHGEFFK